MAGPDDDTQPITNRHKNELILPGNATVELYLSLTEPTCCYNVTNMSYFDVSNQKRQIHHITR